MQYFISITSPKFNILLEYLPEVPKDSQKQLFPSCFLQENTSSCVIPCLILRLNISNVTWEVMIRSYWAEWTVSWKFIYNSMDWYRYFPVDQFLTHRENDFSKLWVKTWQTKANMSNISPIFTNYFHDKRILKKSSFQHRNKALNWE